MHFLSFFQKKRKICEAVRKVLSGVTEALGTFIQDLAAVEDGDLLNQVSEDQRGGG